MIRKGEGITGELKRKRKKRKKKKKKKKERRKEQIVLPLEAKVLLG